MFRIFAALDRAAPSGRSASAAALMNYGVVESGPGLAVVISDFFDPAGVFDGLRYLQYRGLTPIVVALTKSDKLAKNKRMIEVLKAKKALGLKRDPFAVSAQESDGIEPLFRALLKLLK